MILDENPPTISLSFAPSWNGGLKALVDKEGVEAARNALKATPDAQLPTLREKTLFEDMSHQIPPDGDWTTWLLLGGRGAGKTFAGAHWVGALVKAGGEAPARIALVGETIADVRDVMVEGPSGLIAVSLPSERPRWIGSKRLVRWDNGAVALAFSSEDPESLRGPQFSAAWCDELAKWRHAEATWDMLQFGLRLGERPRQVVTTTPRPIPLVKRLLEEAGTAVTRARTAENFHLAKAFMAKIVARYEGTRLGRQELDAELIEERADALWTRDMIEALRVIAAPALKRIVVAVDPPASSEKGSDACGIVAAGLDADGIGYVLCDATAERLTPARWAKRVVDLYHRLEADRIVAEANQGGEMVEAVIRQADESVPIRRVHARRGKYLRAEPIAALYEKGKVRHVGAFPELEDEMCDYALEGLSSGRSPDRLDALVWALSALMLTREGKPRVRVVGQ
jgi:phage terminase large subunit-like protein